jgi:hypothetical protein
MLQLIELWIDAHPFIWGGLVLVLGLLGFAFMPVDTDG